MSEADLEIARGFIPTTLDLKFGYLNIKFSILVHFYFRKLYHS